MPLVAQYFLSLGAQDKGRQTRYLGGGPMIDTELVVVGRLLFDRVGTDGGHIKETFSANVAPLKLRYDQTTGLINALGQSESVRVRSMVEERFEQLKADRANSKIVFQRNSQSTVLSQPRSRPHDATAARHAKRRDQLFKAYTP
jgi:hypothetical protein